MVVIVLKCVFSFFSSINYSCPNPSPCFLKDLSKTHQNLVSRKTKEYLPSSKRMLYISHIAETSYLFNVNNLRMTGVLLLLTESMYAL